MSVIKNVCKIFQKQLGTYVKVNATVSSSLEYLISNSVARMDSCNFRLIDVVFREIFKK